MKNKNWTLVVLLAAGMGLAELNAATYFASPEGTGNGTSIGSPTTLKNGISKLQNPGDTLYLLSGVYYVGTTDVNSKVGTADQRIVISGYEGTNSEGSYDAILDFRQTAYGSRGLQIKSTCSYVHVKNLALRYSGKNNLINYGSYNLFENLDIYGGADTGCQMKEGGNNIIKNVDSHDNFDYELDKSGSLTQCDFGGNADGFADKQFEGAGNTYIGCRAWNNSDDGWDFFQRVSTSQTVLEGCICYANGPASYDMRNHPRYETDKAWLDRFKDGRWVIDADGNDVYVTWAEYPNMGNGNGFKLGGGNTVHNAIVLHCLAVANTIKGFDQNNDAGTLYLYNNTAYDNGIDYGFYNANGCALYIRNCISYNSHSGNMLNADLVEANDHNSWNDGFSVRASDFQSTDESLILAARNADGSLPVNGLMRLRAGSALVDAGVNVGYAYKGTAPDLGCYETDGAEPQPEEDTYEEIFYWQMTGTEAPANGSTLIADGGTIYAGTTNDAKAFGVELADYVSSVPQEMRATGDVALKMTSNVLYLKLELTSDDFQKNDTLYLCGYNVWKISTSLEKDDLIDSIQTGLSASTYDIAKLVLPATTPQLVLARNRGKGTGVSAITIHRPKKGPQTLVPEMEDRRNTARKMLLNGQIVIVRGEELYSITGEMIKRK